jgi:hypothetical protein
MSGCSPGALSSLLIEPGASPHTFDASSETYDFLHEDVIKQGSLIGGQGISGTRSSFANRVREAPYMIGGKLHSYTCAADLDKWLPRILGAAETATDTFDVAETLPSFGMLIDRVGGVFEYQDCMVNRAIWRGRAEPGDGEPELVEQILEVMALDEVLTTTWPVSPPSLSVAANRKPYIVADSTLTFVSTEYYFSDFIILIDNHIQPRWVNHIHPTALCPQDRTVILRLTFPFTSVDDAVHSGIYQNANRATGVTATMRMLPAGAAYGTLFTFTGLQWAQVSPPVRGKRNIELIVDFVARRTGLASEIVVTNDNTT